MEQIEILGGEYYELLSRQQFNEAELDYAVLENHKPMLQQLSLVGNLGVSVFDLYKQEHAFTSYNFSSLFGYDLEEIEKNGTRYFDSRVHPEDLAMLIQNAIALLHFFYRQPQHERHNYKLINEYRIRNAQDNYVRVIEQHQTLELAKNGSIWLALGVIDISPDQGEYKGVKSQLINYKTAKLHPFLEEYAVATGGTGLTKREKEILHLVKDGLLSKEISDRLFISVNTVNTHRQRILEKLGAGNSAEAVVFASKLGLL